jgi:hypothetical protein
MAAPPSQLTTPHFLLTLPSDTSSPLGIPCALAAEPPTLSCQVVQTDQTHPPPPQTPGALEPEPQCSPPGPERWSHQRAAEGHVPVGGSRCLAPGRGGMGALACPRSALLLLLLFLPPRQGPPGRSAAAGPLVKDHLLVRIRLVDHCQADGCRAHPTHTLFMSSSLAQGLR